MKRRIAIKKLGLSIGGSLATPSLLGLLYPCQDRQEITQEAADGLLFFSKDQAKLVAQIAELIVPPTATPGAKDAQVHVFIDVMLADCYYEKDQQSFLAGLSRLESASKSLYHKPFLQASPQQQVSLLKQEARIEREPKGPTPFFRLMKELTLLGYFTSEPGATQALAYVAVPGRFEGCVPLREGQKAWAI